MWRSCRIALKLKTTSLLTFCHFFFSTKEKTKMDRQGIKDLATLLMPISVANDGQLYFSPYQCLTAEGVKKLLDHSNKAMVSSLLFASFSVVKSEIVDLIPKTKVEAEELAKKAKEILGNKPPPKINNKRKREYDDAFRYQGFKESYLAKLEDTLKKVQEALDVVEKEEFDNLPMDKRLEMFRTLVSKLVPAVGAPFI